MKFWWRSAGSATHVTMLTKTAKIKYACNLTKGNSNSIQLVYSEQFGVVASVERLQKNKTDMQTWRIDNIVM